jgi:[glutamine synthetase] adenylyltransferase / [glutamine synthetase]-adenylyl-L-tyrosine phosphorylase
MPVLTHSDEQLLARVRTASPPAALLRTCADPGRCTALYRSVLARAVHAVRGGVEAVAALLDRALAETGDPERGLLHLDRYLESAFSPSGVLDDFLRDPGLASAFLRLVCASGFAADVLVRDPELLRWLTTSGALQASPQRAELCAAAREVAARFTTAPRRTEALRRFQRRHLLRILAADVLGGTSLMDTARQLSWLADAVLAPLLDEAFLAICGPPDVAPRPRIAIIALGKLGGEELNYSSDIDLMAVHDGGVTEGAEQGAQDTAAAVVKEMIRLLGGIGGVGLFHRVDFRLRPDGAAGAIVLSLPATLTYYESRGARWERQMLLRARMCAGDTALGSALFDALRPFMFPRTTQDTPADLCAEILGRLRERWSRDGDVKHCRGGIRHIEFAVQARQLLGGATHAGLRARGTLAALEALADVGSIAADNAGALHDAYVFLRRTEHAVMIDSFEQTHMLPSDERERARVAHVLGFDSIASFDGRISAVLRDSARICDGILRADGPDDERPPSSGGDLGGFERPEEAAHLLRAIIEGRGARPRDARHRRIAEELTADVAQGALRTAVPDETLRALESLLNCSREPGTVLALLAAPALRRRLLRLAALAPVVVRGLERDPLALDLLFSREEPQLRRFSAALSHRRASEARAMDRLLSGASTIAGVGADLARAADAILTALPAMQGGGDGIARFAIVALGKYGGCELLPGGDLDLMFVADPAADDAVQRRAADVLAQLQGSAVDPLYSVDARLRPEGRSAPLAISLAAWKHYLATRASLWEMQSLLKGRVVASTPGFAGEVDGMIDGALSQPRLTSAQRDEIHAMRRKMEPVDRFGRDTFFDVKLSPGGLADVDFAVQALQLASGPRGGTMSAFTRLAALHPDLAGRLARMEACAIHLRTVQLRLRTLVGTAANLLPDDEVRLRLLARSTGFSDAVSFLDDLRTRRTVVRTLYEELLAHVPTADGGRP